jgi:hypothetical protein
MTAMPNKSELLDHTPKIEPKVGERNVTVRLSGQWLSRWNTLMECAGKTSPSDVMREALALLFAGASLDESGEPVRLVLRRKDAQGREMPDIDAADYLGLPTIQAYRNSRSRSKRPKI